MRKALIVALLSLICVSAAHAGLVWDHDSKAVVKEWITDIGGGKYQYTFELTNNDVDGIWSFDMYTRYQVTMSGMFPKAHWYGVASLPEDVAPQYDARNVDPLIRCIAGAGTPDQPVTRWPIVVGERVGGFGFIASLYDPSPKLFIYELQGNCAVYTGDKVSALGYSVLVPEPASLAILGGLLSSALGIIRLRRRPH